MRVRRRRHAGGKGRRVRAAADGGDSGGMSNDVAVVLFAHPESDRAAAGLAGAGQRLAQQLGGALHALAIDPEQYQPEEALAALVETCHAIDPRAVLLSNDAYSQEIAPRLAHRLGGSACGDVVKIDVEPALSRLESAGWRAGATFVTRQVYGGKALATIALKRTPAVLWLRARSFEPGSVGEVRRLQVRPGARTRIVERTRQAQGEARLEDARVIVSGGRGIGGVEGFQQELRPLAQLLGAQIAASRAACDAG